MAESWKNAKTNNERVTGAVFMGMLATGCEKRRGQSSQSRARFSPDHCASFTARKLSVSIITEAEGYLDLAMGFAEQWPIEPQLRMLGDAGNLGNAFDQETLAPCLEGLCRGLVKSLVELRRQLT